MSSLKMRRRSSRHDRRWKILYVSLLLITAILILAALIQPYFPETQSAIYGQWSPTGNFVENTGPLQNAPSARKEEPFFAADRNFPTGRELINILLANHSLHLAITFVLTAVIIRNACRSSSISTIARLERDAAQQELTRLKKEFSIILENSHSFLFRTDKQGRIYSVSSLPLFLTLKLPASSLRNPLSKLVHPDDQSAVEALFSDTHHSSRRHAQARLMHTGEHPCLLDICITPLLNSAGEVIGFAGSMSEITEIATLKRQLKDQIAFIDLLLESIAQPICLTDLDGRYLSVNRAWEQCMGLGRDQILGLKENDFLPSDVALLYDDYGNELPSDIRHKKQLKLSNGAIRELRIAKFRRQSHDGHPLGSLVFIDDTSDFKSPQNIKKLAPTDAKNANGDFAVRINRELRHPLQTILGYSELGMTRSSAETPQGMMFKEVHAAGMSMLHFLNELISGLDAEFHIDSFKFQQLDTKVLIEETAAQLASKLLPKRLTLELQLGSRPLNIKADPLLFTQVLHHILNSAIDFSLDGQSIKILADIDNCDDIHISIADSGPANALDSKIESAEIQAVFESVARVAHQSDAPIADGLDMDLCQKIIKAHSGRLYLTTAETTGVVFHLVLPRAAVS
ncbi:PAS domain-containing sensor histidine kinase [Diaphorobacter sp.]|uniref:sensor histidine kinase n=1 Tax=Diaphorobacter sp. TaxID=1934310 RepID=UPI00258E478C|nr:PAS domain-containing sensor histidine kinase [Diaphorobacter sp.]